MIDRKNRVFIGGITESVRKDELEKEFEKFGKLTSVWVAQNPPGLVLSLTFIDDHAFDDNIVTKYTTNG
jgi:RNA recognition motif-containing protein